MKNLKIGFIGLGLMGLPMAHNILKSGSELTVWNRSAEKAKELVELGAKLAKNPSDVAKESDVVITMVTGPQDVEGICFGTDGIVSAGKKNLIVVDMSTIGVAAAREIAEKLKSYEIDFVDAPVTGSTPKAVSGELTIFVGAKPEVFGKVKPVLQAMGTNIWYMGAVGTGQAIKLVNNHLIAASIAALAEGFKLGETMGLDKKKLAEVLETVPAISGMQKLKMPNFVSNTFPLMFTANNMSKDVHLALTEAKANNLDLSVLQTVCTLYEKALEEGKGEEDLSAIFG